MASTNIVEQLKNKPAFKDWRNLFYNIFFVLAFISVMGFCLGIIIIGLDFSGLLQTFPQYPTLFFIRNMGNFIAATLLFGIITAIFRFTSKTENGATINRLPQNTKIILYVTIILIALICFSLFAFKI